MELTYAAGLTVLMKTSCGRPQRWPASMLLARSPTPGSARCRHELLAHIGSSCGGMYLRRLALMRTMNDIKGRVGP